MANVNVTREDRLVTASIEGAFDERVDLEKEIGTVLSSLRVSCGLIKRFNSIGVKNWIKYFETLRRSRVALQFEDLSPAVVEMCNSYRNFLAGGRVSSLQIPFQCSACKEHFTRTRTIEQLTEGKFSIDSQPCPKCSAAAEFDDLPDAYFGFLLG